MTPWDDAQRRADDAYDRYEAALDRGDRRDADRYFQNVKKWNAEVERLGGPYVSQADRYMSTRKKAG